MGVPDLVPQSLWIERVAQSFVPGNADKSAIFTPERATFYMLVYGKGIQRKHKLNENIVLLSFKLLTEN